jgi:hypothetical protein
MNFFFDLDTYEVSVAISDAFQINTQIAEKWEVTIPEWMEHHRDEWAFVGKAINPKSVAPPAVPPIAAQCCPTAARPSPKLEV